MARDVRISFKISEEKKQELEKYAEGYGVTMSALCALIIGRWLHEQERVVVPIVQTVSEVVKEVVKKELEKEGEALEVMKKALAETDRK
jgi:antitoxin component of RelBE/YafQ-DinJ toxin-antitoxin module